MTVSESVLEVEFLGNTVLRAECPVCGSVVEFPAYPFRYFEDDGTVVWGATCDDCGETVYVTVDINGDDSTVSSGSRTCHLYVEPDAWDYIRDSLLEGCL